MVGFFLESYHASIRKRQAQKAKFYFFDCGVTRALQNQLRLPLTAQTITFGSLFEQFVILEFIRINDYKETRYKFSYFLTKDGAEIDLVIERPGLPIVLVEIKSSSEINDEHAIHLRKLSSSFQIAELYVLNNSKQSLDRESVKFRPWQRGLAEIFFYRNRAFQADMKVLK